MLLNIALHGMEEAAGVRYMRCDPHGANVAAGAPVLVRYADDFVVLCHTRDQAEQAWHRLGQWLAPRNLSSQLRRLLSVHLGLDLGLVDPELGWHHRRVRAVAEPLGVGVVGGGEGVVPVLVDGFGGAEVDRGWGVPGDPGVPVDVVVLVEEAGAELAGVSQ